MERSNLGSLAKPLTAALTAGFLASITWLPQAARGELVYEDAPASSAAAPSDTARVEERGTLRQALSSAERARDTRQAQYAAQAQAAAAAPQVPVPVTVISQPQVIAPQVAAQQVAPQAAPQAAVVTEAASEQYAAPAQASSPQGDSVEDLRNMNKTELMRRARVREELRNEDALQERLEELRLRDEKRRTDQILGVSGATGATGAQNSNVSLPAPLYGEVQEQAVSAPVTERPGEAPRAPQGVSQAAAPAQAVAAPRGGVQLAGISSVSAADQSANPSVMTASVDLDKPKDKSTFYVSPRAGLGTMSSQGGYDINPKFAGGIAVGVSTSEYLSFELGYTYAEYGVSVASGNPLVQNIQYAQNMYSGNPTTNTLSMKQNVIDAGVKLHLMDSSSRVRPFLGGGAAWGKNIINYDESILNNLRAANPYGSSSLTSDYDMTSYMGYLTGGMDVKMTQNISLNLMAKYYAVLSSSENSNLMNYAFYNPNIYANQSPEKQYVGGSMGKANFFTILGGMSFAF